MSLTLFERIFKNTAKAASIGLVGEVNTGKSTLANRFAVDFTGAPMSSISEIPHETRDLKFLEKVDFNVGKRKLDLTLVDTPGIATAIDFKEFTKHGMDENQAMQRAKEATAGIVSAIKYLKEIDVALVVMDSTKAPFDQVSLTLLGALEMNNTKTVIVANKTDLADSREDLIRSTFPHLEVIPISALTGAGVEKLYEHISRIA